MLKINTVSKNEILKINREDKVEIQKKIRKKYTRKGTEIKNIYRTLVKI